MFCYLSLLTRSWYWLNEKLCGFLYCPWFNAMSLLSWNNWIGCNSIQQPWSNLSDSDAWAKAFYRLIESSMAGWCDSLVERQNLGERNIYCMSPLQPLGDSSALKISNELHFVSFFISIMSLHYFSVKADIYWSSSFPSLLSSSLPLFLCILYPSFGFLVLSTYSSVTNFHPHTHSETVCVFLLFIFFLSC